MKSRIKDGDTGIQEQTLSYNGASKIGIIAFAVLFLLFLIVNYAFNKDTSLLIYLLIGITAIFAAGIFYLHNQTINELRLSEIKYNRAIGLLNKIKLKYVNIAGRLTYSYEKHGVKSAYQLNKIWGAYLTLKKNTKSIIRHRADWLMRKMN